MIGIDKFYHLIVGFLISEIALFATFNPYYGVILALIAGVLKEVYDYYFGGDVDAFDIVATTSGGLVPMIVLELLAK